ncbi:MAG: tyrosine decarboxylase MfnA [Candidatus Thorarchaeota archaeon]|nr:MAG: tyrosine decarboxylase MfnA [Candidatus Thorarchaeota archaeon]
MFEEQGMDRDKILEILDTLLANDATYQTGRPVASMSTIPHRIGSEVFSKTLEKNAGRLHTFKGSGRVEQEVIAMIGNLLNLNTPFGTTTSGGTESNILAMLAARESSKKITRPEIIAPRTIHFSVDKAAWLLGVKLIKTSVDKEYRAIPRAVESKITKNTVGMFCTAGTTYLGQVDPIDELGKIAHDHGLPLHVDAAFGAFVLPFLKDLHETDIEFDFKVNGVTSISSDPHKMGLAPIPAGCIIFREQQSLKAITRKVPYLQGASSKQATILGTRPAASILATWAVMKHLGREGYRETVKECMRRTRIAKDRINRNPLLRSAIEPVINIIGIKSKEVALDTLVLRLEAKGWSVSTSPFPPTLRLIVMPHVTEGALNAFLNDLDEAATTIPAE